MRRRPLASAFVTTAVTSGCAWGWGGGVQYVQATDGHAAFAGNVRGAVGIGGQSSLTLYSELGLGVNPASPSLWGGGAAGIQWSSLPERQGGLGWRAGAGVFVGASRSVDDRVIAPALRGELLYGLNVNDDVNRGPRTTSIAFGLMAAYDVSDPVLGPVFGLSVSLVRDGAIPFGNPPPPRPVLTAPITSTSQNIMAVDPPGEPTPPPR